MADSKVNINNNALFNMLKSAFGIIYPLITFPYISRVLMAENVGKINFGSSIISYFALFASLGVSTYAIRECAKAKESKEALSRVSSEIFTINLASTAISYFILAILLIVAKPLESYRLLICIQSATILFATLGADWLNTAMEDFRFIALRTIAMQIISLILMFSFVHKPEHYIVYACISVIASSGANIANILYRRRYCRVRITRHMNIEKHLPPILMMFSLTLSQIIYVNSDITILGLIKGDFQVGLYSTSVKIYSLVNMMIASISLVVMPQLSAAFAKQKYSDINRLLKYAINFIVILGLPCICGIEIIAPQIIVFFAGSEYADASLSLRILGISLACSLIGGWIGNASLIPAGREKICLKSSVVCAIVNIVLNLLLIPKWGLNAAAFTTAISEFTGLVIMGLQMDKNIQIDGALKMIKAPALGCVGIVVIGTVCKAVMAKAWMITMITIFTSVVWYIALLFVMRDEFFLGFTRPLLGKLKGGRN